MHHGLLTSQTRRPYIKDHDHSAHRSPFLDVRVVERRIRRGELTRAELEAHLDTLPDVAELSTISKPLEEPDDRARERRAARNAKPSFVATRMPLMRSGRHHRR